MQITWGIPVASKFKIIHIDKTEICTRFNLFLIHLGHQKEDDNLEPIETLTKFTAIPSCTSVPTYRSFAEAVQLLSLHHRRTFLHILEHTKLQCGTGIARDVAACLVLRIVGRIPPRRDGRARSYVRQHRQFFLQPVPRLSSFATKGKQII